MSPLRPGSCLPSLATPIVLLDFKLNHNQARYACSNCASAPSLTPAAP
jgi:hypothetical protein